MVFTGESHGCDGKPGGRSGSQINAFSSIGGGHGGSCAVKSAPCSAHDQHLAVVVHRCRAPVAGSVVAIAYDRPGTASGRVQVAGGLVRSRVEDLTVWCQEHIGVVGELELRAGETAPGTACCLPHLRQEIHTDARIDHSGQCQHVPVRQCGGGGVPAAGVHIRQARPGVGEGAVSRSVGQAHVIRDVPAYDKQPAVREEREARAENIVAGVGRYADAPCGWIPKMGAVIRVRIPKHDPAGREHLGVYRSVRPRLHGRPLADTGGLRIQRANASSAHDQERQSSRQ